MTLRKSLQASFAGGPSMLRKDGPMTLRKVPSSGPMSLRTGTLALGAPRDRRACGVGKSDSGVGAGEPSRPRKEPRITLPGRKHLATRGLAPSDELGSLGRPCWRVPRAETSSRPARATRA